MTMALISIYGGSSPWGLVQSDITMVTRLSPVNYTKSLLTRLRTAPIEHASPIGVESGDPLWNRPDTLGHIARISIAYDTLEYLY